MIPSPAHHGFVGRWGAAAALSTLLLINILLTPNFARFEVRAGCLYGTPIDILRNGAPVMLLATGMTLVIATAGIDLSVGAVMALAGAVAALLMTRHGQPVAVAMAAALLVAALAGVWNGVLVTYVGVQPIIATLVLLVGGRGLALWLTDDQKVRFEVPAFESLANGHWLGLPAPIYIAAGVAIVTALALRRTVLGMYVEAIGGNARAARLCGLRVHAIQLVVYGFCALWAGLAGLIATANIKEADVHNCGMYIELDAILAVVIGGTSLAGGRPRLLGALIGALIMQTLTTALQMHGVVTERTLMFKAIVALTVCMLQAPRFSEWMARARPAAAPA